MDIQQIRRDVYFLLGLFLVIYIVVNLISRKNRIERMKYKKSYSNDKKMIEYDFDFISRSLGLKNDLSKGKRLIESVMTEMGMQGTKISMRSTKKILHHLLKKHGKPTDSLHKRCARPVIKYMYLNFQLCIENGPYYEKTQKKLRRKLKRISKKEIEKNLQKRGVNFDDKIVSSIKKNLSRGDLQNDFQDSLQNQMMTNMQDQMMMDMQNQMMFDMQNQMMTDMQNQMMSQMQSQMQADMMQTMHDSQMAITSYDHGGHMNNFDSAHHDFNNHLGM